MNPGSSPRRIVVCPTCKGDSVYGPDNPFRPFCSARCKNVDFGAWASESYRVPAKPDSRDADADEAGEPPAR
jgi:endogenous inhibitor of DNA gyrase (YacG/DUF329 family)